MQSVFCLLHLLIVFLDENLFQRLRYNLPTQVGFVYFLAKDTSAEDPIADEWQNLLPEFDTAESAQTTALSRVQILFQKLTP